MEATLAQKDDDLPVLGHWSPLSISLQPRTNPQPHHQTFPPVPPLKSVFKGVLRSGDRRLRCPHPNFQARLCSGEALGVKSLTPSISHL